MLKECEGKTHTRLTEDSPCTTHTSGFKPWQMTTGADSPIVCYWITSKGCEQLNKHQQSNTGFHVVTLKKQMDTLALQDLIP